MEGTNEDTLISIRYYQERLEKYSRNKNEDKILYVISKLERLPIKTFHLENTGVGRSVNGLKKMGGNIAEAAKNLVAQWKDMVREEEQNSEIQETVNEETAANCSYSSEENYAQHEYIQDNMNEEYQKSSSDNDSFREERQIKSSDKDRNNQNYELEDINRKENRHKSNSGEGNNDSFREDRQPKSNDSFREDRQPKSNDKDRNNQNYELEEIHRKENRHKSKNGEGHNDTEEPKHKVNKNKEKASVKINDREDTKTKTNDGRNRHKTDDKREKKHKSDRSSKVNEEESGQKYHRHDKHGERLKNEDKYVHSHAHEKIHVHEGSSKSSLPKSSDNDRAIMSEHKSRSKDKKSSSVEKEKKSKHKSKHSSSREKERKQKRRHSSSEMSDTDDTKPKLKKSKQDVKVETKHKSREPETKKGNEKVKLDKHKSTEKLVNGIDSHSGASFAEALGMCASIVSSKNSTKKKSEKTNILEKNGLSSKHSIEQDEEEDDVPTLLKQPNLEPLNLNIASLLPEITPNYRPLGLPIDSQPRRILTDDEALSRVMMNKNQRTKVYSGNKSHGKVETLFDLCVRVLQDNIDALEYTGGVPYIILKPVLEKATADQLFNMEHHNPYLVEDTDYLWKRHCEKQFRTKKREELESWRDMYMRCLDEREARLNAITANIKQSQDKSIPIRTTKLAYVDSVVKPPRNIARKQAKNGICETKKPLTPTERLSLLSKSGEASKVTVPNPGGRAVERHSSSTSVLKQKKAPLMAKTLSLFKNRFKR